MVNTLALQKIIKHKKIININKVKLIFYSFLFLIGLPMINSEYNIIVFNSHEYRAGHFAFNSNGDMIIEYSKDNYRLFYGLKKNGKYFFKDNEENEVPTKEIEINNNGNDAKRYESQNIFVLNNNDNTKQYLFSIGTYVSYTELHDLDTGEYIIKPTNEFLGNTIFSYIFSLLELTDSNNKIYLITYIYNQKYMLQKFSFTEFSLSLTVDSYLTPYETKTFSHRIVNSFIMDTRIVMLFVNWEKYYEIYIFDFNFILLNNGKVIKFE